MQSPTFPPISPAEAKNVIELRPGIMQSQPVALPFDVTDPENERAILAECKRYGLSIFQHLTGLPSDNDIAIARNHASTVQTILACLATGRAARDLAAIARTLQAQGAYQAAIEQAQQP